MRTHGHREGSTALVPVGGNRGGTAVRGSWGGIAWREIPDTGEGEEKSKAHCHVCAYATVLHAMLMYPKT